MGLAMAGKTVTRADLCEAVYQKVGLSRTESATLVELVLKEITDCLERGETVKLSSFGSFVVRKKGQRIGRNPKTGKEVPISPRRVMVFKPSAILKQRINSEAGRRRVERRRNVSGAGAEGDLGKSAGRIPHHQRGRRRDRRAAARAALLGKPFHADPADEARRRPALLPPGRCRSAARRAHLLYGEGYTIRGVQRILREQGESFVQASGAPAPKRRRRSWTTS